MKPQQRKENTIKPPPEPPPYNIPLMHQYVYPVYEYDKNYNEDDINHPFIEVPVKQYYSTQIPSSSIPSKFITSKPNIISNENDFELIHQSIQQPITNPIEIPSDEQCYKTINNIK